MMTDTKTTKINGFEVKSFYAGIDTYIVLKDDKEICTTWDYATICKKVGCTVDELKEAMWKAR